MRAARVLVLVSFLILIFSPDLAISPLGEDLPLSPSGVAGVRLAMGAPGLTEEVLARGLGVTELALGLLEWGEEGGTINCWLLLLLSLGLRSDEEPSYYIN